MATQIADAGVALSRRRSSSNEATPAMSKLETTRLALAQEQKKRIDAAVARVTSKREGSKRKGLGERGADAVHRSKKLKTVVDVTSARAADRKQSSLARRMVDRFAARPEPEHEEGAAQEPVTRSVTSVHQFVTYPKADAADAHRLDEMRLYVGWSGTVLCGGRWSWDGGEVAAVEKRLTGFAWCNVARRRNT